MIRPKNTAYDPTEHGNLCCSKFVTVSLAGLTADVNAELS